MIEEKPGSFFVLKQSAYLLTTDKNGLFLHDWKVFDPKDSFLFLSLTTPQAISYVDPWICKTKPCGAAGCDHKFSQFVDGYDGFALLWLASGKIIFITPHKLETCFEEIA